MRAVLSIMRISIRELIYERVFYLLIAFSLAAMVLSFLLGQMTYAEQEKLTMDFLLGGIELSMMLFSVFMGISLFQRELTLGTVALVLSKPISRATFILGKFLGQILIQFVLIALLMVFVGLTQGTVNMEALLQSYLSTSLKILILTSLTYLFAVNTGAILSAISAIGMYLLGHFVDAVSNSIKEPFEAAVWKFIRFFVPSFEMLNLKNLTSYGIIIPWNELSMLGFYALLMTGVYLSLAIFSFNERDILT